jgi:hypothetical protein
VAEAADTWAQVTLVAASGPVTLTEPERASIAKRVGVLMAGCAISSVTARAGGDHRGGHRAATPQLHRP